MPGANTTYNKGDVVQEDGRYVCVPCGYTRHLTKGEVFPECISCLSGTPEGHEDFAEGLELWERVSDVSP